MLLKTLKVTNSRGSTMSLPLEDISGGYVVKEISGLGPVKATLVSSGIAGMDGEQYHSGSREPRNIVIKLGLEPDYATGSVFELRSALYSFFMPKTKAKLEFGLFDKFSQNVIDQNFDVEIDARIESLEPDVFSKEPAVDLSLMCFDPEFIDPDPVIFEGSTVDDLTETTLTYAGTVETGAIFKLMVDRTMSDFAIYFRTPDEQLKTLYFEYDLLADDVVEISSVPGSKYVTILRSGIESHIVYAMSPQSSWLEFFPGDNDFRVHASGAAVPFSIEYTNKYGGL